MTPLTVIGGFLGAGKTSLVNHLLRTAARRWGVLVNDFGAINIDASLIVARDGQTVALTNGCVCCGMGDDLGAGLARLAAASPAVDHVVIEASGVSDPRRLAQLALVEPGFSLEPVVVLTDAAALAEQLDDRWIADTVRCQIAGAEVVVLNKLDRADTKAAAQARVTIHAIRPDAQVIEASHGIVPDSELRFPSAQRRRFHADRPAEHHFRTWHWLPPGPLDRERLRDMLLALPRSVLRVKGFCLAAPLSEPYLLQFASGQWTLSPHHAPPLSLRPAGGFIVIGTAAMPGDSELEACFSRTVVNTSST